MYFAPYMDASGIHIPTYEDRLQALLSAYRSVFGQDVRLTEASPDYQLLSVFARALDDFSQLLAAGFAARNPDYASGTALDLLAPLHGLRRNGAGCSTVTMTLAGTPGALLAEAPVFLDDAGFLWQCAAGIRLDGNGAAQVTAVCRTAGEIAAPAGTVRTLVTPVTGLTSGVNAAAAAPGTDAETDASLRRRVRLAAAAPAQAGEETLLRAVLAVPGVRKAKLYVNEDGETDANGIPGHSVCAVVSGGTNAEIGKALFLKKAPGIGTAGDKTVSVTDGFGQAHTVRFRRAVSGNVAITVELDPLAGFRAETAVPAVRRAVAEYAAGLDIGQELAVPALYAVCGGTEAGGRPTFSVRSVTASVAGGAATAGVVAAAWNQLITIQESFVTVNVNG